MPPNARAKLSAKSLPASLVCIETGKRLAMQRIIISSIPDADALSRTLAARAQQGKAEHIAIDGKTLRGSRHLDDKAVHVCRPLRPGFRRHRRSDGRTRSERDHRCARFAERTATGRPHHYGRRDVTQREICRHIRDGNGHYLFTVKDNQSTLKAGIAEAFGDLSPLS